MKLKITIEAEADNGVIERLADILARVFEIERPPVKAAPRRLEDIPPAVNWSPRKRVNGHNLGD